MKINLKKQHLVLIATASLLSATAQAQQPVLKIGVNGVMSGPAASWGLVNKKSAETTAAMINARGGWQIGSQKYRIEIVAMDDKNDPKLSAANAKKLTSMGIKYIIGPNVDNTAAALVPVMEKAGAMNFPYAFSKFLYVKPRKASVLGMVASYQAGPVIYKYLRDKKGVKNIAFLTRNEGDPLNQRAEGLEAANDLGLNVVSSDVTYEPSDTDFFGPLASIIAKKPDLLVLSGVAPQTSPLILKAAREMGYKGLISTETGQDAKYLKQAGAAANGFIVVGGASTASIRSPYMQSFMDTYTKRNGQWDDEAATKVYALEIILRTLQKAGPKAINDTALFRSTMENFSIANPLVKTGTPLKYVGKTYFGQPRQIGVPMVVNEFRNGTFQPLFVGSVE